MLEYEDDAAYALRKAVEMNTALSKRVDELEKQVASLQAARCTHIWNEKQCVRYVGHLGGHTLR